MSDALLLFVKWPEPGRVKTRLAATMGGEAAAAIYRRLTQAVCEALPPATPVVVLFDPPEKGAAIEGWLLPMLGGRAQFRAQAAGDLGARLTAGFAEAFRDGWEKVAAIGSDCVDLSPALFSQAWEALDSVDGVVGPTNDGGYYLIALKRPCPALFEAIAWSTEHTLAQTLERASEQGLSIAALPVKSDVDTENDWRVLEQRLGFSAGNPSQR